MQRICHRHRNCNMARRAPAGRLACAADGLMQFAGQTDTAASAVNAHMHEYCEAAAAAAPRSPHLDIKQAPSYRSACACSWGGSKIMITMP